MCMANISDEQLSIYFEIQLFKGSVNTAVAALTKNYSTCVTFSIRTSAQIEKRLTCLFASVQQTPKWDE